MYMLCENFSVSVKQCNFDLHLKCYMSASDINCSAVQFDAQLAITFREPESSTSLWTERLKTINCCCCCCCCSPLPT